MPWSILDIPLALPVYALILFRLGGLALTAPIFSSTVIPIRIRSALILTLAAMLFPIVGAQAPRDLTLATALAGGAAEMVIGLIIGLGVAMIVSAAEVTGMVVGQQAGLALGEVFDPTIDERSTVVGQMYSIVLLSLFLIAGGHRATIAALLDTFQVIPLLSFRFDESFVVLLIELVTAAFIVGIRLAGPVLIALFLTEMALAFLSRTIPQMNILSVGFTFRVLLALAVAGLTLAACEGLLLDTIWDGLELIRGAFGIDPSRTRLVN